ncbi:hypothetical protein [Cyanobium sp. Morenito 9A2]|nr:hypothetical protein [Cyanobium sp. Morenito 9A2]MCP9848727.1 hypothetical protein [Cyanobium sp. Morenito 9A2]
MHLPAFGTGRERHLPPASAPRQSAAAPLGVGPDAGLPVVPGRIAARQL